MFHKEEAGLVYCPKCGAENTEDAKFCAKCGATLYIEERRRRGGDTCFGSHEQRVEDECFGIPGGGAIAGILFGVIIILVGLSIILGLDVGSWIGPFIMIVIGALILIGALLRFRRKSVS